MSQPSRSKFGSSRPTTSPQSPPQPPHSYAPSRATSRQQAAVGLVAQVARQLRRIRGSSGITGRVRGIRQRPDQKRVWLPAGDSSVYSFFVDLHDQPSGNLRGSIPIEMRGQSFRGVEPADGDEVTVPGRWRKGKTMRPRQIIYTSNGARFKAKGMSLPQLLLCIVSIPATILGFAFYALFLVVIVAIIIAIISG